MSWDQGFGGGDSGFPQGPGGWGGGGGGGGFQEQGGAFQQHGGPPGNYTVQEQEYYHQLWTQLDPQGMGYVEGPAAVNLLMASGLPQEVLHQIWELADTAQAGHLTEDRFFAACRLVAHAQANQSPNPELEHREPHALPDFDVRRQRAPSETSQGGGSPAPSHHGGAFSDHSELQPVILGGEDSARHAASSAQQRGRSPSPRPFTTDRWAPSQREKRKYASLFLRTDWDNDGYVQAQEARDLVERSGLDSSALEVAWEHSDVDRDGRLNFPEFVCLVHLITCTLRGAQMPGMHEALPTGLTDALNRLESPDVLIAEREASRSRSQSPGPSIAASPIPGHADPFHMNAMDGSPFGASAGGGDNVLTSWEVVSEIGPIPVHSDSSLGSTLLEERLARGALVEEIVLQGDRLNYRKLAGDGPETGWVSLSESGYELVRPKRLTLGASLQEARCWEVVGGYEKGGITVRKESSSKSKSIKPKLARGAFVEQLALEGDRLQYKLLAGEGPETGWVSISESGYELLRPRQLTPPRRESASGYGTSNTMGAESGGFGTMGGLDAFGSSMAGDFGGAAGGDFGTGAGGGFGTGAGGGFDTGAGGGFDTDAFGRQLSGGSHGSKKDKKGKKDRKQADSIGDFGGGWDSSHPPPEAYNDVLNSRGHTESHHSAIGDVPRHISGIPNQFHAVTAADRSITGVLRQKVDELHDEMKRMQDARSQLMTEIQQEQQDELRLAGQRASLNASLLDAKGRLGSLRDERRTLTAIILSVSRNNSHVTDELAHLVRLRESEERSLEVARRMAQHLEKAYKGLELHADTLEQQKRDLTQELKQEHELYRVEEQSNAELRKSLDELRKSHGGRVGIPFAGAVKSGPSSGTETPAGRNRDGV